MNHAAGTAQLGVDLLQALSVRLDADRPVIVIEDAVLDHALRTLNSSLQPVGFLAQGLYGIPLRRLDGFVVRFRHFEQQSRIFQQPPNRVPGNVFDGGCFYAGRRAVADDGRPVGSNVVAAISPIVFAIL